MSNSYSIFDFLTASTDSYHAVNTVKNRLIANGYTELYMGARWKLADGGKYFVIKEGSSIVAFNYNASAHGFMISAAHTDFPTFKLKPSLENVGAYTRLDIEKYGSMILYSWLDRPLSVSGRAVVKTDSGIKSVLVNIDRDMLVIPSVAIHLNRKINEGVELNPASDMLPLLTSAENKDSLLTIISESAGVEPTSILSHDLYLYNRQAPSYIGAEGEYILSPRYDDLGCAYAALEGFLSASSSSAVPVLALFDNEEIGSTTNRGADSAFLRDVLSRIAEERLTEMLNNTLILSIDVAHAKHPAHPELSDAKNAPVLNGGPVIKYNANQRYTTDAVGAGLFRLICDKAGVTVQNFAARADMPCGSTLGTLLAANLSALSVDIGLPLLSMHSSAETAGKEDLYQMIRALTVFNSSAILRKADSVDIS